MKNLFSLMLATLMLLSGAAAAQQAGRSWIQVEAQPSLAQARERARAYARRLPDVNGFGLGGNWYGILLGPFENREAAEAALLRLRAAGAVPPDAFVSDRPQLGPRIFPAEGETVARPRPAAADTPAAPAVAPAEPDETPAQARRSERRLTREERREIQTALRAAGFYRAAIDGAFGRGTRAAMRAWQEARGYPPTGILTTLQRKALLDEYNAPLISAGMQRVRDPQAGIEMAMPTALVRFSRYEPPFAHYEPLDDSGVRLILISQPGNEATLFGLYDILQTLEIVPPEGPRERRRGDFVIEGRDGRIVTHAEASLKNGRVKGFVLVWPAGDEDRRQRVLAEMKASFTRTDAVLDPAAGGDDGQRVDLVSGLAVRKPRLARSGFFVGDDGTAVTTTEAVEGCGRITLDGTHPARVVARDDRLGIAVLAPEAPLAPPAVARLRTSTPRLRAEITVAGYSYEGLLGAPSLTFGRLADIRGLDGEERLDRLELAALPGDAGGPVLDAAGSVLGMLLPAPRGERRLPEGVRFAADAEALRAVLAAAGRTAGDAAAAQALPPEDLARTAEGMTVLVSCWD